MNILIISVNYPPESTAGPYTAELAEYLRDRGHNVRVITGFPQAPSWKIWEGYRGRLFMRDAVNGIPVFRTRVFLPKDPRKTLGRILFDCSFSIAALAGIFVGKRPGLIVVTSPPLQLGLTALLLRFLTRARIFMHIKDLVPDAAIAVGMLKADSRGARIGHWLERLIYKRLDGISVISDGMRRNLVAKGVPRERIQVLPDYIDLNFIRPVIAANGFRSSLSIPSDDFLVLYSGSVSAKQGLETFVAAAASLDKDTGTTCCVIGEGPQLQELKQYAQGLCLTRFKFFPLQPRDSLAAQLSAADVLLIMQRKTVMDAVFPGKLIYYMAAGRPILAAVSPDSDTGRFVEENQVGIVVPPEDAGQLTEAIRSLRANPERTAELGHNARRTAELQFDRTVVLRRFAEYLERKPLGAS
ncbi:MAG: WcaI family glycosyltransferase [Bryobacteraceae bacterium]|jgi:colanic acid biosynthesis glycosyl transferase WcaI